MNLKSFSHKGLQAFAEHGTMWGIIPAHATRLQTCLRFLRQANSVRDLKNFHCRYHPMVKGSPLAGLWAIQVSAQWRLTFAIKHNDAYGVDYVNYH